MSYFEDFIEPYIGIIPDNFDVDPSLFNDLTDYDTKEFVVKCSKKTTKTYLFHICKHEYDAWVPKSLVEITEVDGDYWTIEIPDWFKFKPLNKIKEIELGVFK